MTYIHFDYLSDRLVAKDSFEVISDIVAILSRDFSLRDLRVSKSHLCSGMICSKIKFFSKLNIVFHQIKALVFIADIL